MINLLGILSYYFVFSTKCKSQNEYGGYDERFGNETINLNLNKINLNKMELNKMELNKIKLNFKKYNLLNSLQSTLLNEIQKTNLAKEYFEYDSIKPFNAKAGGLYKDFDFDFFEESNESNESL